VADASALIEFLARSPFADRVASTLESGGAVLWVPAICDVEVASGLRRLMRTHRVSSARAGDLLMDYLDLPLHRSGHQALLWRMMELRNNFSSADASYVALAELLDADLITADASLARAVGRHTNIRVLPQS